MKNEQNKGNNDAMRLSLKILFFYRRPLAHLGPFSYLSYDRKMMRKTFQESIQILVP
jgi:hypothetical protein